MDEPKDAPGYESSNGPNGEKGLRKKVSELASQWLDERFGGGRDASGLAGEARLAELAAKAEDFVRGFFRGLIDEPRGATEGADSGPTPRPLAEMLPAVEEVTRLITKTTQTVSDSFQDYLREHVAAERPSEPVVIDGKFVVRHGTQLVGRMIQALGAALAEPRGDATRSEAPRVDVKVDFGGLFRSLVMGRPTASDAPPAAPGAASDDDHGEPK